MSQELITPTEEEIQKYLLLYAEEIEKYRSKETGYVNDQQAVSVILHAFQRDYPRGEAAPSIEWRPVSDEYDPGSVLFASILRGTLVSTARMSYPEATHYLSFSDLKDIPTAKPKTPRQIAEEEFAQKWEGFPTADTDKLKELALSWFLEGKGIKEEKP